MGEHGQDGECLTSWSKARDLQKEIGVLRHSERNKVWPGLTGLASVLVGPWAWDHARSNIDPADTGIAKGGGARGDCHS
jgi:hypothetical protein